MNLIEFKTEVLKNDFGDFEMIGKISIDNQIREARIRFRNITDYEFYFNAIDQDYESEDASFIGSLYKANTPHFNVVNRSQCCNGCDFKHQSIEFHGNNCFILKNSYCFDRYINHLTNSDYKEQYLDFIRSEQRRSNIMTMTCIQRCFGKLGIYLGL